MTSDLEEAQSCLLQSGKQRLSRASEKVSLQSLRMQIVAFHSSLKWPLGLTWKNLVNFSSLSLLQVASSSL